MPLIGESSGAFAVVRGVNVGALGDTPVTIPNGFGRYIVDKVTTHNASANLSTSTSTLGLYTAPAAGGTAIVTAATGSITPLTAATKYKDCTVAATTDSFVASTLYVNVGGTANVQGTVDVWIFARPLQ